MRSATTATDAQASPLAVTVGSSAGASAPAAVGRTRATRIIAGSMAASAVLFGVATAVLAFALESQRIHAFHNAVVAALLLVLSAPAAVDVARRPQRSGPGLMMLTVLSVAALLTMAASLTADPFTLPFVLLTAVLWTIRPARRGRTRRTYPSPVLLGMVLAAAVPLTVYASGQAELQRTVVGDDHSQFFHWTEASFYAAGVVLVGLLAAIAPARYRLAAWCAGLALSIFGAASLLLGGYASAVSAPWAAAALVGGASFTAAARWEARRRLPLEQKDRTSDRKAQR